MSDTESAVLDALAEGHREGALWLGRYSGHGASLSTLIDRRWKALYPERRNRPTHRNIERALKRLLASGAVERRDGEFDTYYRLAERET